MNIMLTISEILKILELELTLEEMKLRLNAPDEESSKEEAAA